MEKSFLGTGWSFPPTFNIVTGSVDTVSDELDIRQSLHILISTDLEERIMHPEYGCNMRPLLFSNISTTLLTGIKDNIATAIINGEPRIDLIDIQFEQDSDIKGVLSIMIDYRIRSTNSRQNYVFPYYMDEGTYI